jgi:hypothetical protein
MAGVNYRQLRLEIDRQAETAIYSKIKPLIKQEFDSKKEAMLRDFEQHPVTEALKAGAANPEVDDGLVNTAHGGNLFSLLGFEEGTDPTVAVREVLTDDVKLNLSQTKRQVKTDVIEFRTPVRIPNLETVHEKVGQKQRLAWTSRGFTQLIERGIPWFSSYLFDNRRRFGDASRSSTAIEAKNQKTGGLVKVRDGSFGPIRYVSDILARFKSLIQGK